MTGTVTTERPWVQEMVVVHRIFRRESRHLHDLVGAVRPGDTARAALLAGMAREYIEGLHSHHTSEDELLWPKLLARVDLDAELVLRMEQQHQVVDAGLQELERLLAAWAASPAEPERDALVAGLDRHRRDLLPHLDEEERRVLPLIEEHITVAEWNALGEHARAKTPKDKQLLMLGALLEDATPQESARFMALLPLPVRLLWKTVGRRSYAKQMAAVRNG
ncbi:hemerythrin domain-containing protein [Dactylosporangium vinaceum]|uniref:Hemerythrin domain-containing protein n=1 Tax=Dactylosporangium vinaceum TaxID=53362 RepID=A0ABV5M5J5_9ACTN|nr:hemerythrin domain-containing protein [Dactylosporangium vinaceum]UAB95578.1 hemerythrin domain-containing protein [Dactylosporangium vinaceum]